VGFLSTIPRQEAYQLARAAEGIVAENFPPTLANNQSALASQLVFGNLVGIRGGTVCTGIVLRVFTAAAGTTPTTARVGLADSTGKILVLSGNVNAAASWAQGPRQFAFTAPYTTLADGGYYACVVINGTYGTTQPMALMAGSGAGAGLTVIGSNVPPTFTWAAQSDLPAVGASLTLTGTTGSVIFYMGVY
jgi:hypothetical protein